MLTGEFAQDVVCSDVFAMEEFEVIAGRGRAARLRRLTADRRDAKDCRGRLQRSWPVAARTLRSRCAPRAQEGGGHGLTRVGRLCGECGARVCR